MKRYLLLLLSLCVFSAAQAQSYSERAAAYVTQYKDWAMAEQQRSGVPAAITLAQGIHETNAGASELATIAHNHFGIKCKKEWTGETYAYTDDAPLECFRKYKSALESYRDHSDYLRQGTRYAPCFALDVRDYKGWAHALKRCGYATNSAYAQKLIKLIEDYQLEAYTEEALKTKSAAGWVASTASPVATTMMAESDDTDTPARSTHEYGKLMKQDGLRGFWARQGDVLLEYAIQFKVRYSKLLEINKLPDAPLAQDRFIYIERGGSLERLMAKDPSAPVPAAQTQASQSPVAAADVVPATDTQASQPATNPSTAPAPIAREEATVPETLVAQQAPAASQPQAAPAAQAASQSGTPPTQAFNIAHEKAVEEMAPETPEPQAPAQTSAPTTAATPPPAPEKPAEPQDEFGRLKARLDKVVYARPAQEAAPEPTAPAAPADQPAAPQFHVVKAGETAYSIARQYGISMQQLLTLNKLSFGSEIKTGQKLRVK